MSEMTSTIATEEKSVTGKAYTAKAYAAKSAASGLAATSIKRRAPLPTARNRTASIRQPTPCAPPPSCCRKARVFTKPPAMRSRPSTAWRTRRCDLSCPAIAGKGTTRRVVEGAPDSTNILKFQTCRRKLQFKFGMQMSCRIRLHPRRDFFGE